MAAGISPGAVRRPFRPGIATRIACFLLAAFAAAGAGEAPAQSSRDPVSLVAGSLRVDQGSERLVASDGVTAYYRDQILRTDRIVYDRRAGRLMISEPLTMVSGGDVAIARSADVSDDFRDAIIDSANVLIGQELQLAAARMVRRDGRYKILANAIASSCRICSESDVPAWRIRSRSVIHDEQDKKIYFEGAVLEIAGIPVAYVPNLRVPDPSVRRASGFLVPTLITSNTLGTAARLPYYLVLSDHADVTLAPFVSTGGSAILEAEFRRNFGRGNVRFDGAVALADALNPEGHGSFLRGNGQFSLPREFELTFEVEAASNKTFPAQYRYSGQDRLLSRLDVERTRAGSYLGFGASQVQSLRTNETDRQVPLVLPDIRYYRTWNPRPGSGTVGLRAHSLNLIQRTGDGFTRNGLHIDWRNRWQLKRGLQLGVAGEVGVLHYATQNLPDPGPGTGSLVAFDRLGAAELRWPLSLTAGETLHRLGPVVQVVWSPDDADDRPDREGVRFNFEDSNLLSPDRIPGFDRPERGLRANVGVNYGLFRPSGLSIDATVGRVFRERDLKQFDPASGHAGKSSSYVGALHLSLPNRLELASLGVFDDRLRFSKFEQSVAYTGREYEVGLNYIDVAGSAAEEGGQSRAAREITVDGRLALNSRVDLHGSLRRNLISNKTTEGEFGMRFTSECTTVLLSFSLSAATSGIVEPTRELSLTVELLGLSGRPSRTTQRQNCVS